jgi:hypothetical protein
MSVGGNRTDIFPQAVDDTPQRMPPVREKYAQPNTKQPRASQSSVRRRVPGRRCLPGHPDGLPWMDCKTYIAEIGSIIAISNPGIFPLIRNQAAAHCLD